MENTKTCFKCGRNLPISEFYKHPSTADGHLNKCKQCSKIDVKKRYSILSMDGDYMEKERARGRDKFSRLYKDKKYNSTNTMCPEEKLISRKLKSMGIYKEGYEAHHWNYNFPKSVILLPNKVHKLLHKYIYVNYEDKMCYTLGNVALESRERSEKYYNDILENNNINIKVKILDL